MLQTVMSFQVMLVMMLQRRVKADINFLGNGTVARSTPVTADTDSRTCDGFLTLCMFCDPEGHTAFFHGTPE